MSTRAAALAGTDQQGGEAGAVDAHKQAEDFVRQKARSRRETMPALLHSIKPPRLHAQNRQSDHRFHRDHCTDRSRA
jgi:hypothetical protein